MKTLLILVLAGLWSSALSQDVGALNYRMSFPHTKEIKDGWYSATVEYSNYRTGTNSEYTLDVEVKNSKVVRISFGEEKYIHDGYNSSGYTYDGGRLIYTYNRGAITEATTEVTIYKGSSIYIYKIKIK